jgi:hypothetical protein
LWATHWLNALQNPAFNYDPCALFRVWRSCDEFNMGDCSDGRQGFAPEAHRRYTPQIIGIPYFAGCVPLESQNGVFGVHAASVVADTNQPLAAFLNTDGYSGRARVNGVLNQLLDNRCGSLNDLPRSNLGSDIWRQNDYATQNFFASALSLLDGSKALSLDLQSR